MAGGSSGGGGELEEIMGTAGGGGIYYDMQMMMMPPPQCGFGGGFMELLDASGGGCGADFGGYSFAPSSLFDLFQSPFPAATSGNSAVQLDLPMSSSSAGTEPSEVVNNPATLNSSISSSSNEGGNSKNSSKDGCRLKAEAGDEEDEDGEEDQDQEKNNENVAAEATGGEAVAEEGIVGVEGRFR